MSHPAWVCGLKHQNGKSKSSSDTVTPCVGVWIETLRAFISSSRHEVTPCVGVWIETVYEGTNDGGKWGHTLRGCVD